MRDKIRQAACTLLIRHGYQGLRFGDIARELNTTRANIHYHHGTKSQLVDEVIADYVGAVIARMREIWESESTYEDKVIATMELNRRRYLRFNTSNDVGEAPWSLISRMRLEANLLSEASRAHLRSFSRHMERFVEQAIAQAQANGEIATEAPVRDIAVQIVSIIDSAGPITQDAGCFARLEHLYLAHMRVIAHAYVSKRKLRPRRALTVAR